MLFGQLSVKERILQAEKAYQKFCSVMGGLSDRQKRIVAEAIRRIEKQQIEKIRKKII